MKGSQPRKKALKAVAVIAFAATLSLPAAQYSKLGIITAAKQAGKWEALKAWIATAGYTDEWQAAAYFSDSYPAFSQITNAVVSSGLATSAEIEVILSAATDTAPDALLVRVYAQDMESPDGRRRWHGPFVSTFETVTNGASVTIRRIDTHEDGYVHVETSRARQGGSAPKRTLEERIASLQAEIARLCEVRDAGTNEVAAAYAIIKIAAKEKQLERLKASQTNVVNVVIQPGA